MLFGACQNKQANTENNEQVELTQSGLDPKAFEADIDGEQTHLYTLKNSQGMEVCITNFGARIVSVNLADKDGVMRDVALGFDNINDYINVPSDFGAAIGRFANRIGGAKYTIDGETVELIANNNGNTLHGGPKGWQYKVYSAEQPNEHQVDLTLNSPDGDMNFPGNVTAKVSYTLTDDNSIDIKYTATTDKKTVVNMTNHSYFNLSGDPSQVATDHVLYLNADAFTPTDEVAIPTGEIVKVKGTPMDFTEPRAIADNVANFDYEQIKFGNGFDHNWILNTNGDINLLAAKLTCPKTGISIEMYTNEPGVQVYTGNFLNGQVVGKKGIAYPQRSAVCLETQHFPDSPNKPQFPSVVLEPGQTYQSECLYKFTVSQ